MGLGPLLPTAEHCSGPLAVSAKGPIGPLALLRHTLFWASRPPHGACLAFLTATPLAVLPSPQHTVRRVMLRTREVQASVRPRLFPLAARRRRHSVTRPSRKTAKQAHTPPRLAAKASHPCGPCLSFLCLLLEVTRSAARDLLRSNHTSSSCWSGPPTLSFPAVGAPRRVALPIPTGSRRNYQNKTGFRRWGGGRGRSLAFYGSVGPAARAAGRRT